ncbi:MAG: hypothetical protein BWX80_03511 [Candidatus Hydrogenedentes bacterium ADurb.Bin101]|nr:MAG: hypothetical protein BWX80_03511 [Candidatus Hydrogenedentes bacterium ADurb.Bin101]
MKFIKILLIFCLGAAAGLCGGGYLGYHVGSTNQAIKYAPAAGMVPVQEEHRPVRETMPQAPANAPDEPVAAKPEVTETPVVEPVVTEPAATETPVAEPAAAPQAAPAAAGGIEEFLITPNDASQIMWVGYKEVATVQMSMEGGFANFEGKLTVEDNDPAKSFVEVLVDMKSIFSSNSILTTVLKSEAFFKTSEFAQARFASTKIEPADNGYVVTGNFTMKGVTQGVQFPAVIERRDNGVFAKAEFKVDRKMWDVGYDNYEDSLILKDVVISFEILAEPAA